MNNQDELQPIIVKKVKKGGDGHHGGAWKVAYADFVTAMMAFFLMLWLISAADEATLDGLAEYFTPTIGLKDQLGIGFEGGSAVDVEGKQKTELSKPGIVVGRTPQGPIPENPEREAVMEGEQDAQLFEKAEEDVKRAFESDPNLRDLADNIVMEQTPEGLKIDITDSDKYPMFTPGSTELTIFGKKTLGAMGKIIDQLPNFISITGHTDAVPTSTPNYTNWELSADRANSARRYFMETGMEPTRVMKVLGQAARDLLLPESPKSPRNRRITVILLRGSYLDTYDQYLPASRDLLRVPTKKDAVSSPAAPPAAAPAAKPASESGALPGAQPRRYTTPDPIGTRPVDAIQGVAPMRPQLPGLVEPVRPEAPAASPSAPAGGADNMRLNVPDTPSTGEETPAPAAPPKPAVTPPAFDVTPFIAQ